MVKTSIRQVVPLSNRRVREEEKLTQRWKGQYEYHTRHISKGTCHVEEAGDGKTIWSTHLVNTCEKKPG